MGKTFKKILCTLLVVVMCLTSAPLQGFVGMEWPKFNIGEWFGSKVSATNELSATGQCGDNVYWNYNVETGELVISGNGNTYDYSMSDYEGDVWSRTPFYKTNIKSVIIKDGISSIGDEMFYACHSLESVLIGDNVMNIGYCAFYNCKNLSNIIFGKNVKTIGDLAFAFCDSLTNITIPDTVTIIGSYAFSACKMTDVTIGKNVTVIDEGAFMNCYNLKSVTMSNSITTIGEMAFHCCSSLVGIVIPDSVTNIGDSAFISCNSLKNLTIGSGVTTITRGAFGGCDHLTNIILGENVSKIEEYAFSGCKSFTSLTIPNSVTFVGDYAFQDCCSLQDVYYNGSMSQWQLINIGLCNYNLINSTIHYNSSNINDTDVPNDDIPDHKADVKISFAKNFYEVKNGTKITISGDIACSDGIGNLNLNWSCSDSKGVKVESPGSQITISETQLGFSVLVKGLKVGTYTVSLTDSATGVKESVTVKVSNFFVAGREFDTNIDYYTTAWDSHTYNANLANLTCALSADVYNENSIKSAYKELGFKNVEVFDYEGDFKPWRCGYSIGFKESEYNDDIIFLIVVRGSDNPSDWVGNFDLRTNGDCQHKGFAEPAERIIDKIYDLIEKNQDKFGISNSKSLFNDIFNNVKFVITGHSRGAAVANVLGYELMQWGMVDSSNIYNYNFACPDIVCWYDKSEFNNIFNLCNRMDPVPFVPGSAASALTSPGTSWEKYGQTYWFTTVPKNTVNPFAGHAIDLYLDFFDQRLNPQDWKTNFGDKMIDKGNWALDLITKILCPVDVRITDDKGTLIASVIDGKVNYYDSKFGEVIILTDGDKKIIYTDSSEKINIDLVGTDVGTMRYSVEKGNFITGEVFESKTFENVVLEKGKTMYSSINPDESISNVKLFVVSKEDNGNRITHTINTNGSEDIFACSCRCHKTGFFAKLIWKIINFFNKLLKKQPICECNVKHW